jgi:hypothetical protein
MTARSRVGLLAVVLCAGVGEARAQRAADDVQFRVDIERDTVTIGDPFIVQVRIRVAPGSTIEFPPGPDTAASVAPLDPRVVRVYRADSAAGEAIDSVATYRLAAWDVGDHAIDLGPATVRTPRGARQISVGRVRVFVRSVLPADTTLHVPRPARPLFALPGPWWWPWLPVLLAAALVGWFLWWWWRRRRGRMAAGQAIDPYDLAEREFARIEALGLLEAGERGRFVALMVEVLRDYLAARIDDAHPSLTSSELMLVVRRTPGVPADRLGTVLGEADLIKFARRPVTAERARELAREARAIVQTLGRRPAPEPVVQQEAA